MQHQKGHRQHPQHKNEDLHSPNGLLKGRQHANILYIMGLHTYTSNTTPWATPGMELPYLVLVGDISAPVATNSTLRSAPCSIFFKIWLHSTEPPQPQPEPPAFTS